MYEINIHVFTKKENQLFWGCRSPIRQENPQISHCSGKTYIYIIKCPFSEEIISVNILCCGCSIRLKRYFEYINYLIYFQYQKINWHLFLPKYYVDIQVIAQEQRVQYSNDLRKVILQTCSKLFAQLAILICLTEIEYYIVL